MSKRPDDLDAGTLRWVADICKSVYEFDDRAPPPTFRDVEKHLRAIATRIETERADKPEHTCDPDTHFERGVGLPLCSDFPLSEITVTSHWDAVTCKRCLARRGA